MFMNRYLHFQPALRAAVVLLASGCTADAANAPEQNATEEQAAFMAGSKLYEEKLSQTARLELWDQGTDGVLISMSGHNDYDADKQQLLLEALDEEGSSSIVRLYRRLRPDHKEVPNRLFEIDKLIAEREAAEALEPTRADSGKRRSQVDEAPDSQGRTTEAPEPSLPSLGESPLTWMAVWFRDTFCTVAGNEHSVCLLDRTPNPYIQQTSTGYRHVITANTDYRDVRFRGWSSCAVWCSFELMWDERVPAGSWRQRSWLGSNHQRDRRGRVDAWDQGNLNGPLVQFSMNWSGSSGGSTCRATGESCSSTSPCCLSTSTTRCVSGICKNDPTPGSGCDWFGDSCCVGTTTGSRTCSNSADPRLWCNGSQCVYP